MCLVTPGWILISQAGPGPSGVPVSPRCRKLDSRTKKIVVIGQVRRSAAAVHSGPQQSIEQSAEDPILQACDYSIVAYMKHRKAAR